MVCDQYATSIESLPSSFGIVVIESRSERPQKDASLMDCPPREAGGMPSQALPELSGPDCLASGVDRAAPVPCNSDEPVSGVSNQALELEKAAISIQAAFKGYAVRRCNPLVKLRRISYVRTKLKRLQTRACDPVYIDKLCVDEKENRRMTEDIMAMLLELDSIQGVLPDIRRIRKSAILEVIQFQEIVDAITVDAVRVDARAGNAVNVEPADVNNQNPRLRRVISLDDNVYPEQSYMNTKKTPSDGESSNLSSDDDTAPMKATGGLPYVPPVRAGKDGNGKGPVLGRSTSGVQRNTGIKGPLLGRTNSEIPRSNSARNLLARSISEVQKKATTPSPSLDRSISEIQRKREFAESLCPRHIQGSLS